MPTSFILDTLSRFMTFLTSCADVDHIVNHCRPQFTTVELCWVVTSLHIEVTGFSASSKRSVEGTGCPRG